MAGRRCRRTELAGVGAAALLAAGRGVACVEGEGFGDGRWGVRGVPGCLRGRLRARSRRRCESRRGRTSGGSRVCGCSRGARRRRVPRFPFPFPVERCCWPVAEPRELRATADVLRPGADAERPGETVGAFALRVSAGGVSAVEGPPATAGGADGVSLAVAGGDAGGAMPAVGRLATAGTLLAGGVAPDGQERTPARSGSGCERRRCGSGTQHPGGPRVRGDAQCVTPGRCRLRHMRRAPRAAAHGRARS